MKKILIAIGVLSAFVAVWVGLSADAAVLTTRNCGSTAVIKCGVFNQSEMDSRLDAPSRAAFKHFGISTNLSGAKTGTLKVNGDVIVDGKVVATGAQSIGRGTKSGTTLLKIDGYNFYRHSAKSAFVGYDTPVFVFFNSDGTFKNAFAKICGNPIIATPTPKPKPKPEPKPEAKYTCHSLTVEKLSRTSFKFSSKYIAQNAEFKSATYTVKDASGKVVQEGTSNTFNADAPGKYTVEVHITFTVDGKDKTVTSADCKKEFVVEEEPKPEAKYTCHSLAVEKLSRTSFKFSSKYTAQNATFKSANYIVKDASGKVVKEGTSNTFEATAPGKYTVEAHITFTVDGQEKTVTSADCKKEFVVEEEPVKEIEVCELKTKNIIKINEKDFDDKKHSRDLKDCDEEKPIKKIEVCELKTKNIIKIDEKDFDDKKHSRNLADCDEPEPEKIEVCELDTKKIIKINEKDFDDKKHSRNLADCDEPEPEKMKVCELETKGIITINKDAFDPAKHSENLSDCDEPETPEEPEEPKPEIPEELPTTGLADNIIVSGFGLGSVVASTIYYAVSRRNLFG